MSMRSCVPVGAVLLVLAFVAVAAQPASGQDAWTVPRTAAGHPDLQGVWANNSVTPLQRPEILGDRATLTPEELAALQARAGELFSSESGDAAFGDSVFSAVLAEVQTFSSTDKATGNYNQFWMVDRDWDARTSLVTEPRNGRLPTRTAAADAVQATRAAARARHARGPEDRSLGERCISWGVPRLGAGYNSYTQVFQSADHVVLYMEMGGSRVIPLDAGPHVDDGIRQLHGDSRGHFEGDTLVIDTTNYSTTGAFMGSSDGLHLVERLTRVADDALQYQVTITDSKTWDAPWSAMVPLKRSTDSVFEYACHEGNIGMEGIMSGARAIEQAEAAGGGQD